MQRLILGIALALGVAFNAYGQTPVVTTPSGAIIHNDSTTIITSNTFQSIWSASTQSTGRIDCIIQNNGAASMYIYFGPIANATTPNSLILAAAGIFKCGNNGVITKDQISITGTSGQNFFAIQY